MTTVEHQILDHFISELGPANDLCPVPGFFAGVGTTFAFAKHSSSSFLSQEMSLNIDINRILSVKFFGVSPNLLSKSVTFTVELHSWKIFHSNSVGSPLIPSKSLQLLSMMIHPILSFQASLDYGCLWTLPRHNTESEKT